MSDNLFSFETTVNGVPCKETHGTMRSNEIIREILDLPPGSVYRMRKTRNAEAYTYLLVVTKKEWDEWIP